MKYNFVFVVLIYRNYVDLEELISSIKDKVKSYKCVVVDAFYDRPTSDAIKKICDQCDADYIEIENKGYSYGNNVGIKYALDNYDFDYVVVSNPDILVKKLPFDIVSLYKDSVIGPKVINVRGKNQNPMYYSFSKYANKKIYKGLKENKKVVFYHGVLLNKFRKNVRSLFTFFKKRQKVFQLHGSFIIFPRSVVSKIFPVFDENMFLFGEESYLAIVLKGAGIDSIYDKRLYVKHKEDGSMSFRNDINVFLRESNIYVYEKYYGFSDNK